MSIDIEREAAKLFPLSEVCKLCPGSKRPTVNCVYRWAKRGVGGAFLEVVPVGGSLMTTKAAVYSFFRALKEKREREQAIPQQLLTEREASHHDRQVERELDEAGFGDDSNGNPKRKAKRRSGLEQKQAAP